MPISMENMQEALGTPPPPEGKPPAPAAKPAAKRGISMADMQAALPKPPEQKGLLEKVEEVGSSLAKRLAPVGDLAKQAARMTLEREVGRIGAIAESPLLKGETQPTVDAARAAFKQAVEDYNEKFTDPEAEADLLHGPKTVLALLNIAVAPIVEGGRAALVRPLQQNLERAADLVAQAATPDEAKKKGIDWAIHKRDVKQALDSTNKALDFAYDLGTMFVPLGPGGEAAARVSREAAAVRGAQRDMKAAVHGGPEPKPVDPRPVSMAVDKTLGFKNAQQFGEDLSKVKPGEVSTVGQLMDTLAPKTEGYAKSFMDTLAKHVDRNTSVVFKGEKDMKNASGSFSIEENKVSMRAGLSDMVSTFLHETVHSVTVGMLNKLIGNELDAAKARLGRPLLDTEVLDTIKNPQGPVLRELDQIIAEANVRAQKAGRENDFYALRAYGKTAKSYQAGRISPTVGERAFHRMGFRYEFIAEVFTNPQFQEFLANSEKYASKTYKFKNMLNQLGLMIGKHLGLAKPQELQLLNQSMRVGSQLMALHSAEKPPPHWIGATIVAKDAEGVVTSRELEATRLIKPGEVKRAKTDLQISIQQLIRAVNPEALSGEAKLGGAVIASRLTEYEQKLAQAAYGSRKRLRFWRARPDKVAEFLETHETGGSFKERFMQAISDRYESWVKDLAKRDKAQGFDYEPRDHYIYHAFEDQEGVAAHFTKKYGSKWLDPDFTKERTFDLYKEAVDAGFVPKYDNPEEIMLVRDQATAAAEMRMGILNDLASHGLATRKIAAKEEFIPVTDAEGKVHWEVKRTEGTTQPPGTTQVRAPTGDMFWVNNDVHQVLSNALFSKSLWEMKGLTGRGFRGAMALKNAMVPVRLALSLFHPLHVAGIDMATGMTRASAEMLSGEIDPVRWAGKMLASGFNPIMETINIPLGRGGWRVVKAFTGKIPKEALSDADAQALKTLMEMGITPEMSAIYRTNARKNFSNALIDAMADARQMKPLGVAGDLTRATWHLPWATLSAMSYPIFEQWIPALKAASALRDAESLLKRNPELAENEAARLVQMRRLGKSVENRYGEMAYNKLFWQRWIKDIAVLNTLSLGWQMGFLREYGGGAMQLGQFIRNSDRLGMVRKGDLDKVLFVSSYTSLGAGMAGLMTWAMTGEMPHGMDYINPRTGETNPDGTPQRVTTMFYSREFAALYKHVQNEGLVPGVSKMVLNKGSGVMGLMGEWATGMNSFGEHVRDKNADLVTQVEQQLAYSLSELEPISMRATQENLTGKKEKAAALNTLGFTPQPKYMSESKTEAAINESYRSLVAPKETSFEKAEYSKEYSRLRQLYQAGDDKYVELLDQMSEKFDLTSKDQVRMIKSLNSTLPPSVRKFISLGREPEEQRALLDRMSPEERDLYLPHAAKKVQRSYIPPEEREPQK